jgi:aspartate/methionine/tyrosine aminotransferase
MTVSFSKRIPGLQPNVLARARAGSGGILDLTESNPTRCGIRYPGDLLAPLAGSDGLRYEPDPMGLPAAREAVSEEYAREGSAPAPDSILLTASTSEAYSLLFKLLCDPGDAVLVPAPSYPLFEHLAALDGVRALVYPLDPSGGWQPDLAGIDASSARALVLVHPNNPTGTYVQRAAAAEVVRFCEAHGLALIVDEVFRDYPLGRSAEPSSARARR